MLNAFRIALLALDFAPGYKRIVGGSLVILSQAAMTYNAAGAPVFGTPIIPEELIAAAREGGTSLLALGVATQAAR